MNDLQVDYFLAVARNLSFTRTAEEFYVTQPADYPNLKIGLECYGVRGLIQALKADKVDAILTLDVTLENVEGIHTKVLTEIPRIILYSSTHPLAQKPDLKPMDFSEETFLVMGMEEVSYAGDLVRDYCRYYGFVPRIQYVRGIESMNACVQNGMGVAR